jgi:superoxide dismutase, Cu-Zn family
MTRQHELNAIAALLALITGACSTPRETHALSAQAFIESRSDDAVRGLARFTETPGGLHVTIELLDAPPGLHSVHVDTLGDCASLGSGGHFNPERHSHGARGAEASHAGDFGNIEIALNGTGQIEFVTEHLTLRNGEHSIVGRTIAIDERRDDPLTQPWGDSGAPIACGSITLLPN